MGIGDIEFLPDTGYRYPVYDIQPDPDFCRVGFFEQLKCDKGSNQRLLALLCSVAYMSNHMSAPYFMVDKRLHVWACLLLI